MEKLNKFLTEAMGDCYHEWIITSDTPPFRTYDCNRCGTGPSVNPSDGTDFLTWEGFGKLWAWARKQEWWHSQFEHWLICDWKNSKQYGMIKSEIVDPENFAKAVAQYLEEK